MDLVDKLRRQAAHDMDVGTLYSHVVDNEAADEIEFLRAQLAKENLSRLDWLKHAQEEAIDLANYLEVLIQQEELK